MKAITVLKALSTASIMLGLFGAMEEMPLDIVVSIFGLSTALVLLAKKEKKKGIMAQMSLNFPADELRKGITIHEGQ